MSIEVVKYPAKYSVTRTDKKGNETVAWYPTRLRAMGEAQKMVGNSREQVVYLEK